MRGVRDRVGERPISGIVKRHAISVRIRVIWRGRILASSATIGGLFSAQVSGGVRGRGMLTTLSIVHRKRLRGVGSRGGYLICLPRPSNVRCGGSVTVSERDGVGSVTHRIRVVMLRVLVQEVSDVGAISGDDIGCRAS